MDIIPFTPHPWKQLGKRAPKLDKRTFKIADFLPPVIPPPPAFSNWLTAVPYFPMYLNDIEGICVGATGGHQVNQWTRYAGGKEIFPTDQDIQLAYEVVGGYDPSQTQPDGFNPTDNGMNILDFLNYFRQKGIAGHKIFAFATVDVARKDQVCQSINWFGNLFIGVNLPISAQNQDSLWAVPPGGPFGDASPGSWGGHAVPVCEYSPSTLTVVTWGQTIQMTWEFFKTYCDEAYVCLSSQDWLQINGVSPSNFNLKQLQANLKLL